jgi:hypothetical protein
MKLRVKNLFFIKNTKNIKNLKNLKKIFFSNKKIF